MPKTRHLADLYVVGAQIEINDGKGEPVPIWLQKLSPIDHELAVRKANSKRSRVLSLARINKDDEETREGRDMFRNELYDMTTGREDIINLLATDEVSQRLAALEAELADKKEWSKDNYLQGLRDSWNDEMAERFVMDPDDQMADQVKTELERFQTELNDLIVGERDSAAKDFADLTDEKLIDTAVDTLIKHAADSEWMTEYRKCEVWLGVRDPKDKKSRYFAARSDVDALSIEVLATIIEAYQNLNVDVTEGKDSAEAQDS